MTTSPVRVDTKGRQQPATKSIPATPKQGPTPSPALQRDALVGNICRWLRADLGEALESILLILRDEGARIAALPRDKCVHLARGYLRALSVKPEDLRELL